LETVLRLLPLLLSQEWLLHLHRAAQAMLGQER
jgi:hypothetical protein